MNNTERILRIFPENESVKKKEKKANLYGWRGVQGEELMLLVVERKIGKSCSIVMKIEIYKIQGIELSQGEEVKAHPKNMKNEVRGK